MNAGVPLKKAVAGVAIGLASYDDMSDWIVLTDIQDLEDGKGGMDFKVTGTKDGVTAIQLDTKTLGIPDEVVKQALQQGLDGRLDILKTMDKAIAISNKELSPHAPRIISFKVDPEKIGSIIGPGGKIINAIIAETGVSIDIKDDGLVIICGVNQENSLAAEKRVKDIVKDFEAGETYKGKVVRILDFGAFVELMPGRDGLVHVSELAPYRISKPSDFISVGDEVTVYVKEIDEKGRVNLTMKGMKENEPLWKDKKGESTGNDFGGGGGNNRGPKR
jgi:polyribonucleotide nucleotidyltransferase